MTNWLTFQWTDFLRQMHQDLNQTSSPVQSGMRYRAAHKFLKCEKAIRRWPFLVGAPGFEPGTLPPAERDALPSCAFLKREKTIQWTVFLLSGHQDLNLGPPAPKAGALPSCATPRMCKFFEGSLLLAVKAGFEPAVPLAEYVGLANRWIQPLSHFTGCMPFSKSERKDTHQDRICK